MINITILNTISPPSLLSSQSLPQLLLFPLPHPFLLFSFQKRTDIPCISIIHGRSNYGENMHLPSYWAWQCSLLGWNIPKSMWQSNIWCISYQHILENKCSKAFLSSSVWYFLFYQWWQRFIVLSNSLKLSMTFLLIILCI